MPAEKTIGGMNGMWAPLFKLGLVLLPLILAGQSWLVVSVVGIQANRFTAKDGQDVYKEMARLERLVSALPPRELIERLARIEERQATILTKLDQMEKP